MVITTKLLLLATFFIFVFAQLLLIAVLSDTNAALHFYSHDNVRTMNGVLNITTERKVNTYKAFDEVKKEFYADKKYIQSGMLQSWNKFCFVGGAIDFSAKLPGDPHKGGLWPACTYLF
jgi:beta-glucanase (GH16 family)